MVYTKKEYDAIYAEGYAEGIAENKKEIDEIKKDNAHIKFLWAHVEELNKGLEKENKKLSFDDELGDEEIEELKEENEGLEKEIKELKEKCIHIRDTHDAQHKRNNEMWKKEIKKLETTHEDEMNDLQEAVDDYRDAARDNEPDDLRIVLEEYDEKIEELEEGIDKWNKLLKAIKDSSSTMDDDAGAKDDCDFDIWEFLDDELGVDIAAWTPMTTRDEDWAKGVFCSTDWAYLGRCEGCGEDGVNVARDKDDEGIDEAPVCVGGCHPFHDTDDDTDDEDYVCEKCEKKEEGEKLCKEIVEAIVDDAMKC
jgi:hypothetical protein